MHTGIDPTQQCSVAIKYVPCLSRSLNSADEIHSWFQRSLLSAKWLFQAVIQIVCQNKRTRSIDAFIIWHNVTLDNYFWQHSICLEKLEVMLARKVRLLNRRKTCIFLRWWNHLLMWVTWSFSSKRTVCGSISKQWFVVNDSLL